MSRLLAVAGLAVQVLAQTQVVRVRLVRLGQRVEPVDLPGPVVLVVPSLALAAPGLSAVRLERRTLALVDRWVAQVDCRLNAHQASTRAVHVRAVVMGFEPVCLIRSGGRAGHAAVAQLVPLAVAPVGVDLYQHWPPWTGAHHSTAQAI